MFIRGIKAQRTAAYVDNKSPHIFQFYTVLLEGIQGAINPSAVSKHINASPFQKYTPSYKAPKGNSF